MTTYYISGPMTGQPGHNYDLFNEVEADLKDAALKGDKIINPARNFNGETGHPRSEYMQLDMKHVLDADRIILLPGWETSEGAKLEVAVARACGKTFSRAECVNAYWTYTPIEPPSDNNDSPRASALDEARQLITGDRNAQYGPPTQDFKRTAEMATSFGFRFVGHADAPAEDLESHHVAIFQMLLKLSRLAWTPQKRDSWVDIAGYSGCGYECSVEEAS